MYVESGGAVAAEHVHPEQTEHFQVERGEVRLRKRGDERTYEAGDEATIPPGTPHVWWNDGSDELHVRVTLRPASRFDQFLATLFALARDGETNDQGMPDLLQMAVMLQKYDDVIYPSSPPRPVQKALFSLLTPLGHLLGYQPDYSPGDRADQITSG